MTELKEYEGAHVLELLEDARNYNRYLANLLLKFSKVSDQVLDFGAGIGTFAQSLSDAGRQVTCVEPDPAQNARIREQELTAYTCLEDVPRESMDLVYSLNVLEHIKDDRAILRLCRTRIRPGGTILIYVPAFQFLYSSFDRMVGHVRRYSRAELVQKVNGAGFHVDKVCYVDSLGFLAAALFKIIASDDGNFSRKALIFYDRILFPASRALDFILGRLFGKNLLLIARRETI